MKKYNSGHNQDGKLNELFDAIARVSFEPAEKARLSSRLEAFVDSHPIAEVARLESKEHLAEKQAATPSPFSVASRLPSFSGFSAERFSEWATFGRKKVMVSAALVLCVFAGSVSAAAGDALPGDILYPVKIHVNENVGIMLSIGAKSQAKKQISYADARLAEAEALSAQNKLDSKTQAVVKENFAAEAVKVSNQVKNLAAKGQVKAAAEISSDFDAYLESHRDLLLAMSEQGDVQGGLLADLASTVDIYLSANSEGPVGPEIAALSRDAGEGEAMMFMAAEAPADSESRVSAKSAAPAPTFAEATSTSVEGDKARVEGARTSAKNKIDAAYLALNQSQTTNVDLSIIEAASAQVNQAQKLFEKGDASVSADQYHQAYILFNQAGRSAQRARLALDSHVAVKPVISIFLRLGGSDEWVESSSATSSEEIPVTATTSVRVKGNSTTTISATTSKGNSSSSIRVENNSKNSVETHIELKTSTGGQTSTGLNGSIDIGL